MSGGNWLAYNNLLTNGSGIVTARTETLTYSAANLRRRRLMPPWRSAERALQGAAGRYCYRNVGGVASVFDYTSKIECHLVFKYVANGAAQYLLDKRSAATNGYFVYITDLHKLRFRKYTGGVVTTAEMATLVDGQWYEVVFYYFSTSGAFYYRVNGVTSYTNITNGNIDTNTGDLYFGAAYTTAGPFVGMMARAGLSDTPNSGTLFRAPASYDGYWAFHGLNSSDQIEDLSGNGRHLTTANVADANFYDSTAWQYLFFDLGSAQPASLLFLDRRHNLGGDTIGRLAFSSTGVYGVAAETVTISAEDFTARRPLVKTFGPHSYRYARLALHDPTNPDGYIEVPYAYLGEYAGLQHAALRGFQHVPAGRAGTVNRSSIGNLVTYAASDPVWAGKLRFRCNATDYATLLDLVESSAGLGRPFVYCEDAADPSSTARLVQLENSLGPQFTHIHTGSHFADLDLRELAAGA